MNFLLGGLMNGKVLLVIAILAVLGFGYYKWTSLENKAEEVAVQIAAEKKNVETLNANILIAKTVNDDNQKVIDQLQIEKNAAVKATADLRGSVAAANKKLDDARRKLASVEITTPPVPLSPYLIIAIDSIQELRKQPEPPTATASAPLTPLKASTIKTVPIKKVSIP